MPRPAAASLTAHVIPPAKPLLGPIRPSPDAQAVGVADVVFVLIPLHSYTIPKDGLQYSGKPGYDQNTDTFEGTRVPEIAYLAKPFDVVDNPFYGKHSSSDDGPQLLSDLAAIQERDENSAEVTGVPPCLQGFDTLGMNGGGCSTDVGAQDLIKERRIHLHWRPCLLSMPQVMSMIL